MTSYISLLQKIEDFCNNHIQIKKFKGEFKEQMPNFSTQDERYPVVFVSPLSDTEALETNQFTLEVYCVDIIQKDRANINTILSDCHLILKDFYLYFSDGDDWTIDVVGEPSLSPVNNFDLDYVAGWVMTITFEVEGYSVCAIPMNPIPPFSPECEDADYTITDEDDNILYSGAISSGGSLTQTIQDSTVTITDDASNVLHTVSVNAEGSATQVISDSTVTITDDSANVLHTVSVNAQGSASQIISDSTAVLKTTAGATLSTTSINAEASADITAPDTALEVNGVSEGSVVAGSTVDVQLSDSGGTVTPDSVTLVGTDLQIVLPDAVAVPVGATLMKTNQTISYATNDDGYLEIGRQTSFFILASNNPFGNTNRFTDELGGQTYANNIIIDWSTFDGVTVLGWYKGAYPIETWANALLNAASLSVGSYTSGWRIPNAQEAFSILNYGLTSAWNYAPFSTTALSVVWTSTSYPSGTSSAIVSWGDHRIDARGKTSTSYSMRCRTFTVTGTILS